MTSLITGAAGHIGVNLVNNLLSRGEKVRAFVRVSSDTSLLPEHKNLEIVHGDVFDRPSITRALSGVDFVYHAAAVYSLSSKSPGVILETAMQGTRNVLEAVKAAGGIKRLVYTSSTAAVGMTSDPTRPRDETYWTEDTAVDEYTKAKLESERLAHKLAGDFAIDLVAVNPSVVLGPLDLKPTPSNKIVADFLKGSIPAYLETGFSAAHVEDIAEGHRLAMLKGRRGERYILSGTNVKLGEFLEVLGRITSRKPPGLRLPGPLAVGMAWMFERAADLTGSEPLATVQAMRSILGRYGYYSHAKAKSELGYAPRGLEAVLESTAAWFSRKARS